MRYVNLAVSAVHPGPLLATRPRSASGTTEQSSSPDNLGRSTVVRLDCMLSKLGVTRVTWLVSREESGVQVSFFH